MHVAYWALHWHGDTFDMPPDAVRIASRQACQNQAFEFGENVVGMQFHLEFNIQSIASLIANCKQDLDDGGFVQSAEQIVSEKDKIVYCNRLLKQLMGNMVLNCSD